MKKKTLNEDILQELLIFFVLTLYLLLNFINLPLEFLLRSLSYSLLSITCRNVPNLFFKTLNAKYCLRLISVNPLISELTNRSNSYDGLPLGLQLTSVFIPLPVHLPFSFLIDHLHIRLNFLASKVKVFKSLYETTSC